MSPPSPSPPDPLTHHPTPIERGKERRAMGEGGAAVAFSAARIETIMSDTCANPYVGLLQNFTYGNLHSVFDFSGLFKQFTGMLWVFAWIINVTNFQVLWYRRS